MKPNNQTPISPSSQPPSPPQGYPEITPIPSLTPPEKMETAINSSISMQPSPSVTLTETDSFKESLPPIQEDLNTPLSRHSLRKAIAFIILVVALGVSGYFVYQYLQGEDNPLTPAVATIIKDEPLTTTKTLHSKFSYPKNWIVTQNGQASQNEFMSQESDESHYPFATVLVAEGKQQPEYINASEETYASLQHSYYSKGVSATFQSENITGYLTCAGQTQELQKDTNRSSNIIGLTTITSALPCKDGDRKSIKRTVIGTDGRMRYILIDATTSQWDTHSNTFETMLTSLSVAE